MPESTQEKGIAITMQETKAAQMPRQGIKAWIINIEAESKKGVYARTKFLSAIFL